jgi:dCTP deaminase
VSVLPDHEIHALCKAKQMVSPYSREQLAPASYDVRLGNAFRVFERNATPFIDLDAPEDITKLVEIADEDYFLLHPGEFVLGVTDEYVNVPSNIVARLEGKSSVGRLGIFVHVTAGYIDPGFQGRITLEMACLHPLPVMLRPGRLIAQLSFAYLNTEPDRIYEGRYQGDHSVAASRYEGRNGSELERS